MHRKRFLFLVPGRFVFVFEDICVFRQKSSLELHAAIDPTLFDDLFDPLN